MGIRAGGIDMSFYSGCVRQSTGGRDAPHASENLESKRFLSPAQHGCSVCEDSVDVTLDYVSE